MHFLKEPLMYVCIIMSCGIFNVASVHQTRKIFKALQSYQDNIHTVNSLLSILFFSVHS